MFDISRVDPRLYDDIRVVIDKLVTEVDLDPDNVLVVGAGCRDILHSAFGHRFPLRATTDTDLGIAVKDWEISNRIETSFQRLGSNGIRYLIAGLPVDIMPFGEIEEPDGITHPTSRGEDLVVFGFRDVFEQAIRLKLPTGLTVRLPQPAGYVALKMRSWLDRSINGQFRDGQDLAVAAFWFRESTEIEDRLYDPATDFAILTDLEMDVDLAAVRLLGIDALAQLSSKNALDLAHRWAQQDLNRLAQNFILPASETRSPSLARRRAMVAQFLVQ